MGGVSLGTELLKVVGFLGLLVFVCALCLKLWGRRGLQRRSARLEVVDSLGLGGNRLICLVRLGKSHVLLGVTDHNVNFLKDYPERDLIDIDAGPLGGPAALPDVDAGGGSGGQGSFVGYLAEEYKKARRRLSGRNLMFILALVVVFLALPSLMLDGKCYAAPSDIPVPNISVQIDGQDAQGGLSTALGILGMLTILTLAPAILILTTSFTRIVIVFSFLRSALGTQQAPPNQVLIGLSLILTFFIMTPTWNAAYQSAIAPYIAGEINTQEAINRASGPLKEFMLRETREKDLAVFAALNGDQVPQSPQDLSVFQVAPAFCISELRTAFEMGFMLYLPFLVVDMVVASTLMSMGMLMLPPVLISLPFKLLLFILVDGWGLITKSLVAGFR
jgi:flagellar biosynthetic protein FliP